MPYLFFGILNALFYYKYYSNRNVNIVNYVYGCYCSEGCSVSSMVLVSFPHRKSMFPLS
jgi:hypothetical protein